ncbi:MAG: peroxide stress protein YaaA [Flavobacteriaceae bacterium]|nr:peroxide stress protein YaaA [Flavobacteriaceae bacterium]
MKIVISPAKTLEFERPVPIQTHTECAFLNKSVKLNTVLKKKSPKKLMELMDISEKLSELNYQRNQDWHLPFSPENARQAVFAFSGDVYEGLDAYTLDLDKFEDLQNKVRILSGLYGILKPLDLMQPYRLEMGTALKVNRYNNLYEFWGDSLTKALNTELKGDVLLNLASQEYFKAIKPKLLKSPVITPEFKDFHNGELKMISFFAKKARGSMVRYIIDNQIDVIEDVKGFNREGYAFDKNLSTEKKWVFTR